MSVAKLRTAFAVSALALFVAHSPANAASQLTEAFLANVTPNVAFLETSSKLALDLSKTAAVRAYAQGELSDATRVAAAIGGARATAMASVSADGIATGRSVAIDPPVGLGPAANGRLPMNRDDVAELAKLSGREFLDTFWLKQLDALSQLRSDYENYAEHGDDPALVALATRELAVVKRRLALLSKL